MGKECQKEGNSRVNKIDTIMLLQMLSGRFDNISMHNDAEFLFMIQHTPIVIYLLL